MSDLVNPEEIESIVGINRHVTIHYAKADSKKETVFILHSHECKEQNADLRDCEYSKALDRGIALNRRVSDELGTVWDVWKNRQDRTLPVKIVAGYLIPKESNGTEEGNQSSEEGGC